MNTQSFSSIPTKKEIDSVTQAIKRRQVGGRLESIDEWR